MEKVLDRALEYIAKIDFDPQKIKGNHNITWKITCKVLKTRALGTCQYCGKKGKPLDIHHVDGCGLNNALSNLITVCRNCHRKLQYGSAEDKERLVAEVERMMKMNFGKLSKTI